METAIENPPTMLLLKGPKQILPLFPALSTPIYQYGVTDLGSGIDIIDKSSFQKIFLKLCDEFFCISLFYHLHF